MFMALSQTADTSRSTWIVLLVLICAMFVACLIIVVRGNHVGSHAAMTSTQKVRIKRARGSLWVLAALIFLTIARIIVAPH